MNTLIKVFGSILIILFVYFFSFQLQRVFFTGLTAFAKKLGVFSTSKELVLQRYIFLHKESPIAKLYLWINEQILALGIKKVGVTPFGFFMFWSLISVVMAFVLRAFMNLGITYLPFLFVLLLTGVLVSIRVFVSNRMERRESDILDAEDLLIPELGSGVVNAVVAHVDNLPSSVKADFKAFISNIQDRGLTFEDSMYILTDNLGMVFRDFAQKAIHFEKQGDNKILEIFADIVESNRLRRDLRYRNAEKFTNMRTSFVVSVGMTIGYALFVLATDEFSRYFFLTLTVGKILLIVMVCVVFFVLSYQATIRSRAL